MIWYRQYCSYNIYPMFQFQIIFQLYLVNKSYCGILYHKVINKIQECLDNCLPHMVKRQKMSQPSFGINIFVLKELVISFITNYMYRYM